MTLERRPGKGEGALRRWQIGGAVGGVEEKKGGVDMCMHVLS